MWYSVLFKENYFVQRLRKYIKWEMQTEHHKNEKIYLPIESINILPLL